MSSSPSFKHIRNSKFIVMFDVDGTLINYDDTPRYHVIQIFKFFQDQGCRMVIASGGGKEYAERWAEKLGLVAEVYDKCGLPVKPDLAFDDEEALFGKVNVMV